MMEPSALQGAIAAVAGYAVGSLPVAWIVLRTRRGVDLRQDPRYGTGAVGALMAGGPRVALLSILLELAKGLAAGVGARLYSPVPWFVAAAIAGCVVGDAFPLLLRRGRRGLVPLLAGAFVALPQALVVGVVVGAVGAVLAGPRGRGLSVAIALAVPVGLVVGTRDLRTLVPAAVIVAAVLARREQRIRRREMELDRWRRLRGQSGGAVVDVMPHHPPQS